MLTSVVLAYAIIDRRERLVGPVLISENILVIFHRLLREAQILLAVPAKQTPLIFRNFLVCMVCVYAYH